MANNWKYFNTRSEIVSETGVSPAQLQFEVRSSLITLPKNLPLWSPEPVTGPAEFSVGNLEKGNRYCLDSEVQVLEFPFGVQKEIDRWTQRYPNLSRKHFQVFLTEKGIAGYYSFPDGQVYLSSLENIIWTREV